MRVAGIDVTPGVDDRDHRLAGVVAARVAHLRGPRAVAEGAQIRGAIPAPGAQVFGNLAGFLHRRVETVAAQDRTVNCSPANSHARQPSVAFRCNAGLHHFHRPARPRRRRGAESGDRAAVHHDGRARQRRDRRQRRRARHGRGVRERAGAARARAAGPQGRARRPRRGRRGAPLQRHDRPRAAGDSGRQLGARAPARDARRALVGRPADRDLEARTDAAARRLHVRGLSQRRWLGRHAQHPGDHDDRAVRRRRRRFRGAANQA